MRIGNVVFADDALSDIETIQADALRRQVFRPMEYVPADECPCGRIEVRRGRKVSVYLRRGRKMEKVT